MTQTLLKVVADFITSLRYSVTEGDTTATLTSADDADDVVLASGIYGFTVDNGTDNKEFFVANVVGTALTNVVSITRQGVATSGFSLYHRPGAVVEVTDWAALLRITNVLDGTTDFDAGTHLGYDGAPVGLTGNEFATVAYVLSVVSGGTVTFDQQVANNQTLGETEVVNDIVYFKEADARWWKSDVDLTATYDQLRLGITKTAGAAGASATIALSGPISGFSGMTPGAKQYLSSTAGARTETPTAVFLGWALSVTVLLFDPYAYTSPSIGQKQALVGSFGIPGTSNLYLTQVGSSDGSTDQSQLTRNGGTVLGMANTTGLRNKISQSFIPAKTQIESVSLYKDANTGTFTGTVTISIQADSAGSPSGVALATKTITNAAYNLYSTGEFLALFSSELAVTVGSTYWIVIETSTSDTSNHPNLGINTGGGYASGSMKYNNTADGWVAIATTDLYFKVTQGGASKAVKLDSSGLVSRNQFRPSVKMGTVTTVNGDVAFAHGLGKLPYLVEAQYADASSSFSSYAHGYYDVDNAKSVYSAFYYNEGTSGNSENVQDTSNPYVILTYESGFTATITVSYIDENIVVFTGGASTITMIVTVYG